MSPAFAANTASSNGFTIEPRAEGAEVAALLRRARVLRVFLRELGELRRVRLRLRVERRRPASSPPPSRRRWRRASPRSGCAPPRALPRRVYCLRVGLVLLACTSAGVDRRLRRRARPASAARTRCAPARASGTPRVLVVELLHLRVVDLDVLQERLGVDRRRPRPRAAARAAPGSARRRPRDDVRATRSAPAAAPAGGPGARAARTSAASCSAPRAACW